MNGGALGRAISELKLADHMIYMTLPLLNDRMIFLNAVNHVHKAITLLVNAFLKKEYDYKRLESMPPEEEQVSVFLRDYSRKLDLTDYSEAVRRVDKFMRVKDKSSVKMKRGDKFVLITPDYKTETITEDEIKSYIKKIELFLNKLGLKLNEK